MRLVLIIAGTFLVGGALLLVVRFWGLAQPLKTYQSEFLNYQGVAFILPLTQEDVATQSWKNLISSAGPRTLIFQTELRSEDGKNVEVGKFQALVNETRPHRLILKVEANEGNIDLRVSELIQPQDEERIMIQSEVDVILRSIKNLRPRLIFGSSRADETRFYFFNELFILPATPFRGDILWLSLSPRQGLLPEPSMVNEVHRRRKKVFVGPVSDAKSYSEALNLGPDAISFSSLEFAKEMMQSDSSR